MNKKSGILFTTNPSPSAVKTLESEIKTTNVSVENIGDQANKKTRITVAFEIADSEFVTDFDTDSVDNTQNNNGKVFLETKSGTQELNLNNTVSPAINFQSREANANQFGKVNLRITFVSGGGKVGGPGF